MHHGEIEGSGFEIIEAEFAACFVGHARLERLWTGCRWAEGPAWFGRGRYLLWSDLPNDRLLRYDDTDGSVSVFRAPAGFANGNTTDREGRLVTCEHGHRRVTRTEHDGRITVLADYEGARAPREQNGCHVYRIDPDNGEVTCVADDFDHPNGLAFSRDERWLFVADSGATEGPERPRHIRRLRVNPDGRTLGDSTAFALCPAGCFDGFRVDDADRLWASSAEGVQVYRGDGTHIGRVRVPAMVANLAFGGARRNRLFICGTTSLYAVYLKING